MSSTSTKPFDDLMSILPNIKSCDSNKTKCTCVDPSYNYGQKCNPHAIGSDKITTQCTFGTLKAPGYENSVSGNLKNSDKYNYTVGTTTGRANFDKRNNNFNKQPPSLSFCSEPTATALPTKTKSQITGTDGTVNTDSWVADNDGTDTQTNLGFDR
jgi:hypothetical protein